MRNNFVFQYYSFLGNQLPRAFLDPSFWNRVLASAKNGLNMFLSDIF